MLKSLKQNDNLELRMTLVMILNNLKNSKTLEEAIAKIETMLELSV